MNEELEKNILAAAEIAAKVAPELQVVAFERAADVLLGSSAPSRRPTGRRSRTGTSKRKPSAARAKKTTGKSSAGSSGGRGQLLELIAEGYFGQPHTLPEIVDHLKHSKARQFKQNNLSGPLARLTRDGDLKRKKNQDGKYAYTS